MKTKKVVVLAAASVMALSAATVASAKTTTDFSDIKDVKIALIGSTSGGNFWGNIESGFDAALEEYGWEGDYWAPSGNAAGQDAGVLDLAETALTQGYNVICPVMNDISIFEDFLNRAKDAGVLVLAYNSNPGEDYVISQVGIDSKESGKQQGEKIAQFATEKGLDEIKYLRMCSSMSNSNQQLTMEGVLEAMEANFDGKITEVSSAESDDNAATAQDAISAQFIANDINTIVCCDQYSAVGAAAYIEEAGLQGEVIACGLSLDADALIRVKDGALSATSSVDSVYMGGEQLFSVVKAIVSGEEFEYKNYPPKIWVLPDEVEAYAAEHDVKIG